MGFFDSSPSTQTTNVASSASSGLPAWYQSYLAGIGNLGVNYATEPYNPYQGPRVAGMTPGQTQAQTGAADIGAGSNPLLPQAQGAIAGGLSAIGTPAQSWANPDTRSAYMSPYTHSVVDEIGRVGNRNFNENIAPSIQDAFIGSGGVGSTRNADIFSRAARDTQADISGRQAQALEAGYGTSAGIFGNDANRALQQQQGAGQLGVSAGSTLGGLGSNQTATQLGGLGLLNQIGNQDQATRQKALDTGYGDFTEQRDWDINNAGKLSQLYRGLQLPTSSSENVGKTVTDTGAGSSSAQGLLQLLASLYGATNKGANNAPISTVGTYGR